MGPRKEEIGLVYLKVFRHIMNMWYLKQTNVSFVHKNRDKIWLAIMIKRHFFISLSWTNYNKHYKGTLSYNHTDVWTQMAVKSRLFLNMQTLRSMSEEEYRKTKEMSYVTMFEIQKNCRKYIFGEVKHAKFWLCLTHGKICRMSNSRTLIYNVSIATNKRRPGIFSHCTFQY